MNERIKKLDSLLLAAWEQVRIAAQNKDRASTQCALDRVAHLENLKQQELALEKSIETSLSDHLPENTTTSYPTKRGNGSAVIERGKRSNVRPREVRIGAYRKQIHYAYEIPITVANWLIEQGKSLPTLHNFVHPSDSGFTSSAITKKLISGQFIEVGDHQEALLQKARKLLDACGYRSQNFEVMLEDGHMMP
jgi:hypothetical protein